jgi:hypothetical protein
LKRGKKIIAIISLIPLILVIGLFSYVKFGGYLVMDKTIKEEFFTDIKNSPQLPERFYQIYEAMYPNSLNSSFERHLLFHKIDSKDGKSCACTEAVYEGVYPLYVKATEIIPIINIVESNFTQRKCLDYYIDKRIKENKIDVENLYSLSDEEIILLLLQIENPSYYNKKRNPDRVQARINEISNILNNNLN